MFESQNETEAAIELAKQAHKLKLTIQIQSPERQLLNQLLVEEYNEPSRTGLAWFDPTNSTNVACRFMRISEGFDLNSDEYYNELDNRLRSEIPNKFDNNVEATKPVQTVASPSRTTSTGRKPSNRVELSPSEQRLAKRLGVSFKDYAIQKARLQKS